MKTGALAFTVLTASAVSVQGLALQRIKRADPPQKLPKRATDNDLRYQPALDFDTDSCYNVPVIGCNGDISEGLPTDDLTTGCRDEGDLSNTNVYSRQRCNSGWCAYMYDYYFEKDTAIATGGGGHTHDWEHILVFVPDERSSTHVKWVCASAHGGWDCRRESDVRWHDGEHPKMVYHKDQGATHAFRFANSDDDSIENHSGQWQIGDLVGWHGFPSYDMREKLSAHDFGDASFALKDGSFEPTLRSAMAKPCSSPRPETCMSGPQLFPFKFDPSSDDSRGPGDPADGPTPGCGA